MFDINKLSSVLSKLSPEQIDGSLRDVDALIDQLKSLRGWLAEGKRLVAQLSELAEQSQHDGKIIQPKTGVAQEQSLPARLTLHNGSNGVSNIHVPRGLSIRAAVLAVLKNARAPLSVKEIWGVLEAAGYRTNVSPPVGAVSSSLADLKRHHSPIESVAKGVWRYRGS